MVSTSVIEDIEKLEDLRYRAIQARDPVLLNELLHDQMLYIHSSGLSDTKNGYITSVRDRDWEYKRVARDHQIIRVHGTLAMVSNHVSISTTILGKPVKFDNRALAVWTREKGAWRVIGLQSGATTAAAYGRRGEDTGFEEIPSEASNQSNTPPQISSFCGTCGIAPAGMHAILETP